MSTKSKPTNEQIELWYLTGVDHFTTAGAEGALGNFEQEAGFSPTAVQAGTGATGIAQWQDSRKAGLEAYAKRTGGSVTSLLTQLGWMSYELQHGYRKVLKAGQTATDPAGFAALWNSDYEISADHSDTRENNATAIAGQVKAGKLSANLSDFTKLGGISIPGVGGKLGILGELGKVVDGDAIGAAGDAAVGVDKHISGWESFAAKLGFALAGLVLVVVGAYATAKPARDRAEQTAASMPIPVE